MTVALPNINLPDFEGPLDLLLHLVREHKVDIGDIPIVLITEQYLAYLASMEERNLTLAGEFFVMAATLLEIKSGMLLPAPPKENDGDEAGVDPRDEIAQRLLEYERFKALVPIMQELELERTKLFFRGEVDYGDAYELPMDFGMVSARALLAALTRVLEREDTGEHQITSVKRHRLTLRLAMHKLLARVAENGADGMEFEKALVESGQTHLDIVMLFLALLELLRQEMVQVEQKSVFGAILIFAVDRRGGVSAE
jgi:segregation and condensation protein A